MSDFESFNTTGSCNNFSTTSQDYKGMLADMAKISERIKAVPNRIITTKRVASALKEKLKPAPASTKPTPMDMFCGMPIEDYDTVKECLDRMMNECDGERLQLVLEDGIPDDCVFHPWVRRRVKEAASRMGFDDMGFLPVRVEPSLGDSEWGLSTGSDFRFNPWKW